MGYCTSYSLYIDDDPNCEKLQAVLEKEGEEADICYAVDEDGNTASSEARWYDWERDMRRISSLWPNFVFHLSGVGEESDDQWEATFRDGKAHIRRCQILIDPYDEACLE